MTAIVLEHARIVGGPQPEPDERDRIGADEFVRGDRSASRLVVAHLDQSMNVRAPLRGNSGATRM